jgi:hypothetical protein
MESKFVLFRNSLLQSQGVALEVRCQVAFATKNIYHLLKAGKKTWIWNWGGVCL